MAKSTACTLGLWFAAFPFSVAILSVGGCQTSGVKQLTDTAPRNVFFPGKSLGAVSDSEFPIGLLGRRGLVSTVVTVDGDDVLRLHSMDGKRECRPGPIARGEDESSAGVYTESDNYFAYRARSEDGSVRLRVLDDRCREPIGPYPNASVVGNPASYQPTSLLILDEAHALHQLSTDDGQHRVVARKVTRAEQTASYLFTLEDGAVTVRDRKLAKVLSVGQDVTEMAVDATNSRAAYVDVQGLFVLSKVGRKPVFVARDACKVGWIDAPAPAAAVQYQKSCTDPTIVVAISAYDRRVELPTASRSVSLRNFGTDASPDWVIAYLQPPENAASSGPTATDPSGKSFETERRFIGRIGEPAREVGWSRSYRSISPVAHGKVLLWLDPGTTNSRVVAWSPTHSADYLGAVTDVVYSPPPMRALVSRGPRTDLYDLIPGEKPRRLLEDAADLGKHGNTGSLLFSSVANRVGDVTFLSSDDETTELLFSSALIPSAGLIWDEAAAIALTKISVQDRRGTLCVRLIESADTFCQRNVTSFMPTYRPSLGVSYVSRVDGKSTLHWAEAR
jgi:hypothetical protein